MKVVRLAFLPVKLILKKDRRNPPNQLDTKKTLQIFGAFLSISNQILFLQTNLGQTNIFRQYRN